MTTMDLANCPLCGAVPQLNANFYATHVSMGCKACGLRTDERPVADVAGLIAAWNRRATRPTAPTPPWPPG